MNCIVIEDDQVQRKLICDYIKETKSLTFLEWFENPVEAEKKMSKLHVDIIFLDVEMPKMDGISFLSNLMRLRPMPSLINS